MSPMGKYDPGGKVCKPRRKLSFPSNSPLIKYISKATVQDSKRAANEAWIGAEIMCWKKWEIWFPDRRNTAPELSLQRKVIVAEVGQEEETVHCRRRCHRPSPVMKPYLEQASNSNLQLDSASICFKKRKMHLPSFLLIFQQQLTCKNVFNIHN